MQAMRYQPQGLVKLDKSSPLVSGAQAIVSATSHTNLVSGVPLAQTGTVGRGFAPVGRTTQFRKAGYIQTEFLPPIGTESFVEFWYGYPSSDRGSSSGGDAAFLTGSSSNNIGIAATLGVRNTTGTDVNSWGSIYHWGTMCSALEVLDPGVLTLLVAVRRSTGTELWRNGNLVRFVPGTPTSYSGGTLICGSFIQDIGYWSSSSDTVLAGRIVNEWTPDQVRQFSANPWQIFEGQEDSYDELAAVAVATASPANGSSYGQGSASGTGRAITLATGASTSSATAVAIGNLVAQAFGLSPGSTTASAVTRIIANTNGGTTGTSNAAAITNIIATSGGAALGSSFLTGNTLSLAQTIAAAFGTSSVSGTSSAIAGVVGSTSGASTVTGFTGSTLVTPSTGGSVGNSSAIGTSNAVASAAGLASGTSSVQSSSLLIVASKGTTLSISDVAGISATVSSTIGTSHATCVVSGVSVGGVHYTAVGDKFQITLIVHPFKVSVTNQIYNLSVTNNKYTLRFKE